MSWRPRSSSLGYYFACSQRAAFDRGIADGLYSPEMRKADLLSPYASLGTVIHFYLQDGLRCEFPGPAKDFAPGPEEYIAAAKLFGNNRETMMKAVEASARAAAQHMPVLPGGVHWMAEVQVDAGPDYAPGHIDFLSSDRAILVDLKTTTRKPLNGRMKRAALIQCVNYAVQAGASWMRALYVDSKGGEWAMPIDMDCKGAPFLEIAAQLPKLVRRLTGDTLYADAYPALLNHDCFDDFCPYTGVCHDVLVPKAADTFTAPTAPMGRIAL